MYSSYETFETSPENDFVDHFQTFNESNTRDDISNICYGSYISIYYQDAKLGISLYRLNMNTIELLHQVFEYDNLNITKLILKQFQPSDVIISSNCDCHMANFLKSLAVNSNDFEQNSENDIEESIIYLFDDIDEVDSFNFFHFNLHIINSRYLQNELCRNRILSTNLPQMKDIIDFKKRLIYLSSYIDFSETNTVNSLGAMLYFFDKNLPILVYKIENFVYMNLNYFVSMDPTTFESLEIFQQEWHPSVSKKECKKEALSLFGIFNTCCSKIGSYQLKKIFKQPITNYDLLTERLDIIDFLANSNNSNLKRNLVEHLKNIKDINLTFKHLKESTFVFSDFQLIFKIARDAIFLRNLILNHNTHKIKLFEAIITNFTIELEEVVHCLSSVINFEKSSNVNRFEINKNIDSELDKLKSIFNKLPKFLNSSILEENHRNNFISHNIEHIVCVYIPQLGFLLALPLLQVQTIPGIYPFDAELIFCANDKVYYKNDKMKEFDAYFGDIKSDINDRTFKLLISVGDFIIERSKTLTITVNLCAKLDSMIAMAQAAINYNYVRPMVSCSGQIKIENGRHPLCELVSSPFAPNHCFNGNGSNISIIFGPNGCGKTVYLKQVSLIVYLAHIGSFVPAEYAEIPLVNQIFTRIITPESISTQLSSFKHDLGQMIMASNYATQRSFVAIDFFGKGTLSTDGYSLLSACVDYWIGIQYKPHILISTQFDLMSNLSFSGDVNFFTFEIIQGIYLYKLVFCNNYSLNCFFDGIPDQYQATQRSFQNFQGSSNQTTNHIRQQIYLRYKKHLDIADSILNEGHSQDIVFDILKLINPN